MGLNNGSKMPTAAMLDMQSVLSSTPTTFVDYKYDYDILFATCEAVTHHAHISLHKPGQIPSPYEPKTYLLNIARASRVRMRQVKLYGKWWLTDNGPLLGFLLEEPCALIPKPNGGYQAVLIAKGTIKDVNSALAATIARQAYYFYRSLPPKLAGFKDIFNFSIKGIIRDIKSVIALQFLVSLFALIVPVATGFLFDTVVPNADFSLLVQFTILLSVNILAITLFDLSQLFALLRVRFKVEVALQAAIWDKLLSLPIKFFNRFTAGDLAFRAGTIADIQDKLTNSVTTTVISGFMSIVTLIFMFYYEPRLALASVGLVFIIAAITIWVTILNLKMERKSYHYYGKLSGLVLQLLTGIAKLRIAHAEDRAFSRWANLFAKKNRAEYKANAYLVRLDTFNAAMAIINIIILYALVTWHGASISFGTFVVFNAAFTQFFAAMLAMTDVVTETLEIIPLYERSKPIIFAEHEDKTTHCDPGELDGHISIRHITFRHAGAEFPLIKDFSLEVKPGEFIALVGPSGSGKSTLLRLLLGFEEPEAGSIYYSGLNLATINKPLLRQQIGVVLQNSALIPGSIFDNIVGNSHQLTRKDAWEIAEKVGIAALIRDLPMGMDTLVIEGMTTLSGGEAQRLMLARALAKEPKLLFLDEATSALDNKTQDLIHQHLRTLNATQVVVAHRLSTIVHATRILVIDKGQVVQTGTYHTLLKEPGLFAELAKRQL